MILRLNLIIRSTPDVFCSFESPCTDIWEIECPCGRKPQWVITSVAIPEVIFNLRVCGFAI